MPVAMTRERIGLLEPGQVLLVTADDPAAEEDIQRWARRTGNEVVEFNSNGNILTFMIRKGAKDARKE
jgi:TusA-related sulfurtransferase